MKKLHKSQIVFIVLTCAVMIIIFLFSSENSDNSSKTSGRFVNIIIKIFYNNFHNMAQNQQKEIYSHISHIIRKMAHFSVYTALGFCSSLIVGKRKIISLKSLIVIFFCFIYACTDEVHQYFVPGRACMFTDVLIDTSGAITGLVISMIVLKIISKKIKGCAE